MRAHRLVHALARSYRVHLRVIPIQAFEPRAATVTYASPCVSQQRVLLEPSMIHRLRYWRHGEVARLAPRIHEALQQSLPGVLPAAVFSFRHCLLQAGLDLRTRIAPEARLIVDLDEMESHTRERLAALHADRGERRAAAALRVQAEHYRGREAQELREVDGVWLCSDVEAGRLESATGVRAAVVPNAVELPAIAAPAAASGAEAKASEPHSGATAPWVVLFIGSLSYLPNFDAAEWMLESVLPVLARTLERPVQFRIVGKGTPKSMQAIAEHPAVDWRGYVQSLGPQYAEADLCVVPLRAGGGTRIKLLEALAHARPVVSTSLGAEGLAISDGSELRIADAADEFASACRELLENPVEARRLATNGRQIVGERYGPAALWTAVSAALEGQA